MPSGHGTPRQVAPLHFVPPYPTLRPVQRIHIHTVRQRRSEPIFLKPLDMAVCKRNATSRLLGSDFRRIGQNQFSRFLDLLDI